MPNRTIADRVLELAYSEMKRWGGSEPTLTHVAFVLACHWNTEFIEIFGAEGRVRVERMLREQEFRGDEAAVRAILTEADDIRSVAEAVHDALGAPEPPGPATSRLDDPAALSARTARFLLAVEPAAVVRRASESAQIASQLLRPRAPIVAVIGEHGVGRTSLIREVAARMADSARPMPIWRMSPETLVANPVASLKMALEDLATPGVIVLDDFDELADLGTQEPSRGLLEAIDDVRFHPNARIVLVLSTRRSGRIGALNQTLDERMVKVLLRGLAPSEVSEVVTARARLDVSQAGLDLGDGVVAAALAPPESTAVTVHPGLALDRIDAAIGRALLSGSPVVQVEHLTVSNGRRSVQIERHDLAELLAVRVRGQEHAIATVSARLALTRAGLDLRPQRPNGVFLFAGPTGVGKTELARQIAIAEYGSDDALIRLDMSEYGEYQFGLTRLIGVGQGYVGQNEPEGWLTTKVARAPHSVVLLDEIEKAHPSVWNTFLQVFDAGRLTDGRGVTADFADTIIIMTSNLGAREAGRNAVGFGAFEDGRSAERQLVAIREAMEPEFINRLDDVVLFNALSKDAIIEIAAVELAVTTARLASAGWRISYDDGVIEWLAETGYDPAYGARHLIRNIESEFLGLLTTTDARALSVSVVGDALVATEA